jgi:hypothetical protein
MAAAANACISTGQPVSLAMDAHAAGMLTGGAAGSSEAAVAAVMASSSSSCRAVVGPWSYAGLDLRAQTVIAEAVGVEPAMLLQDLRTLSIAANFL